MKLKPVFKSKLPRKRKKAYLKKFTKSDYLGLKLLNELFFEDKTLSNKSKNKFPEYNKKTFELIKYW